MNERSGAGGVLSPASPSAGLGVRKTWLRIPAPPLSSAVTLGKLPNLSEPLALFLLAGLEHTPQAAGLGARLRLRPRRKLRGRSVSVGEALEWSRLVLECIPARGCTAGPQTRGGGRDLAPSPPVHAVSTIRSLHSTCGNGRSGLWWPGCPRPPCRDAPGPPQLRRLLRCGDQGSGAVCKQPSFSFQVVKLTGLVRACPSQAAVLRIFQFLLLSEKIAIEMEPAG